VAKTPKEAQSTTTWIVCSTVPPELTVTVTVPLAQLRTLNTPPAVIAVVPHPAANVLKPAVPFAGEMETLIPAHAPTAFEAS
jgi:hypothetical protein